MKAIVLLLPVVPVLVTGCPLLDASSDVSEVCVTYHDVAVDGVATDGVTTSFALDDLGPLQEWIDQDDELAFTRVAIRATDGTDLGFVSAARVTVASGDPTSTLPAVDVVACDGDCFPDGAVLDIPATARYSAIDYVQSGSLAVDVDLHGQVPAAAWHAEVDVCMSGHFHYALEP